jgi:transcriptional regulator with XRE-family HTH domain
MVLPLQIQANREKKGWSQTELGERAGMLRNAVSRLESIGYGNLSVNTLIRLAHAFDFGLLIKFVPFSRLVREFEDLSQSGLLVSSFEDDYSQLAEWSAGSSQRQRARTINEVQPSLFESGTPAETEIVTESWATMTSGYFIPVVQHFDGANALAN